MSFDAQSFLDAAISGSNSTRVIPVPIGEYQGIIEEIKPRQWTSRDGLTSGIAIDITWLIEDEAVRTVLGRDKVTARQGLMLDTTETGALDTGEGKNVSLGRLREAIGKNDPKAPFAFSMLPGSAAKIKVTHRVVGEDTYAEVSGTAAL